MQRRPRHGPFFFNFRRSSLGEDLHGGRDSHSRRKLVGGIAALILLVRINPLRQQPLHHAIASRGGFHRKYGLHEESETLAVLGFKRGSVIEEEFGEFGQGSFGR